MSETVAIIDYGSGNLRSAAKAFERASREAGLGRAIIVTDDPERVAAADRVVLPGVGAFADCKRGLDAVAGMRDALARAVIERGRPFLGICVGMQLMATRGLEHGETSGLGWIEGEVVLLKPNAPGLKIPHMGWNNWEQINPHPLLHGIELPWWQRAWRRIVSPNKISSSDLMFVHSYHLQAKHAHEVKAVADYGGPVVAMVARDNLAGVQFHPEKSQETGLRLIANFLAWTP